MDTNNTYRAYKASEVISFMRNSDTYGIFSNMFPCTLVINGRIYRTSEAVYQALKFADPVIQESIRVQVSPVAARNIGRKSSGIRPDWKEVRISVMQDVIMEKIRQHPDSFRRRLIETGIKDIVEMSYKDTFWGAKPTSGGTYLIGQNWLGRCLMAMRELVNAGGLR